MSLRTVGTIWNCGVWLAIRRNRGVPVTVADSAVDRPLVDVVIEAIDADNDLDGVWRGRPPNPENQSSGYAL